MVFPVGLPRASTTLIEQVLASQSRVEGSNVLPNLQSVIGEESRRQRTIRTPSALQVRQPLQRA